MLMSVNELARLEPEGGTERTSLVFTAVWLITPNDCSLAMIKSPFYETTAWFYIVFPKVKLKASLTKNLSGGMMGDR